MKRLLLLLLTITFAAVAQDFTTTPNLGLKLPKQGSTNWGPYVNQDFTTLDAAIGAFHGGFSTVPFSPTPVFNLTLGNTFQLTLSGNVTSSSVNQPGIVSGQIMYLIICQDSTGGRSFVFPSSFQAPLPTVTTNASQCSATTWLWSSPLHQWVSTGGGSSGGGGGGGNSALKPAPADGIRYVTAEGNDVNDGLSWGTAKATPYAALLSLPNGAVSPPTAGNGIVYVANNLNGIPFGGPVPANQGGWWMFGPGDPGYAGGVTGWMRVPTVGTVTMECSAPTAGMVHEGGAFCQEFWGGHADNVHPAVWFSSFSSQAVLRGFGFNYEATGIKLGIDSTNNRSASTGNSSVLLDHDQVNLGSCYSGIGAGPAVDIGGASFWINITRGSYSGCTTQDYSISSIVRTSNVVTVTLTASGTGDIVADGSSKIIIRNVTDPTFDGAYVIASASGTSLTFAQTGPNATSSGGQAFPYGSAAIGINSGSGPGAGFVYIDDTAVNGGSIWAQGGFNGVGLSANKIVYEGSGLPDPSTIEFLPQNGFGDTSVYVNDVQPADNTVPICGVESFINGRISASNASTCGSMNIINGGTAASASPLRQEMYGTYNKRTIAINSDSARRIFSPTAVRAVNVIGPSSTWLIQTGQTLTNGILAPDGTTGATSIANSTGGTLSMNLGGIFSPTPNLGDYYVYGMWLRSETAGAIPLGPNFNLNSSGLGSGDYCAGSYLSGQGVSALGANVSSPFFIGDGQWGYFSGVCKIIANPTAGEQRMDMNIAGNTTIDVYAPTLAVVAAGTITDNEAWEMANDLQGYPSQAIAGDVTMLPGQRFDMSSGTAGNAFMYFHQGAPTADRTVTWPDSSFTIPAPNKTNTWSANQTFTNGTQLRFLSTDATHYAGFTGGASTSNLVWLFPTTDASGTQCLSSNGSLQLAWSACSAGSGTPGGSSSNVQYNSSGSFAGSGNFTFDGTGAVAIGLANTALGTLQLFGGTSGNVTLEPLAVAGSNIVLKEPNTSGTIADGASSPLALSATTGNLTCATCVTSAASLTANQLVIGGGSQASAALGTLGTTTTLLHGNAGGAPTFAAVTLTTDVTGVLPIANGGTSGATKAAAFDALSPNTTQGDLTVFGSSSNGRLPIGANGTCLVSNGTTVAYGSCASGTIGGSAVSGQATFWTGTNTIGGNVNWLYSAASGHSVIQGANNTDLFYGHRFTDSAPTGNFLHFQNAAANADVAKLDVNGNLTITSVNFNGTGAAGTVNLFQGTAPALIANTVQLSAPASVAAGGIQYLWPGTPASGFIRWTNLTGTETGALVAASGVGACAGGLYVTGLNDNTTPTCTPLTPGGFGSQVANTFLGAPNGSPGLPTFRALVAADIPPISLSGGGLTGILPIANGGTNGNSASSGFNNLSPMTTAGDIIYGGTSGTGTRLGIGAATTVLHGGATAPAYSAVVLTTDVSGTLPIANGGTGATTAANAFNALAPTTSTANEFLYTTGANTWAALAAGGAGTLCLLEASGGTPSWGSCSGSAATAWDALTSPSTDLSLAMLTNKSLFTWGIMTSTRNALELTDGASTSTGSLLSLHTGASSTMKPFTATAAGTANGVQMTSAGSLGVIGTGHIVADQLSRTITTTTPLTIDGGASADLTVDRTLACPTCVTSSASLTSNGVVIGSGGGQGTASTAVGTSGQVLTSNGAGVAPTFQAAPGGAISNLGNATATNTLANGNFQQNWNCAQTSNAHDCMVFGETSAATGGTVTNNFSNQAILGISAASGSTATPLTIQQVGVTAASIPLIQAKTTWNSAGLTGQGLVLAAVNTASSASSQLISLYAGTSGTTQEFAVRTNGDVFLGPSLLASGTAYQAQAATTTVTFEGGAPGSNTGTLGSGIFTGATNGNTTGSAAAGSALLLGAAESGATGNTIGGSALINSGATTSATGAQGVTQIATQMLGTSLTTYHAVCMGTTAFTMVSCTTTSGAWGTFMGVALSTGSPVPVVMHGLTPMTATAAVTIGHTACLSAVTADEITDSGGTASCAYGGPTFVIVAVAGNGIKTLDSTGAAVQTSSISTTQPLVRLP